MKLKKNASLILIVIFFFHILVNSYILNNSKVIREYDEADRIKEGIEFHQMLVNKEYKKATIYFSRLIKAAHPKLFALMEGLILTLLEKIGLKGINWMILFSNALFLLILLISVYKIGTIIWDQKTGLIAAILLSFSPVIFGYSRVGMLDFPLTCMICLCFLSLLKTNNFSSLTFSLLTGILFGLAQLTRVTAIIFILPPFLYYSFKSLYIKERGKQRIINFNVTLSVFLIIAGLVYLNPYNKEIFKTYWEKAFIIHRYSYDIFHYTKCFPSLYLGTTFLIVLLPLVLSYIFNIRKRNLFVAVWFFVPLLFFSFFPNKNPRFLMPVLPALFLALTSEIFKSFSKVRKIYIGGLICTVISQFVIFNFFLNSTVYNPVIGFGLLSVHQQKDYYSVQNLIDIFKKEKITPDKKNKVIFIFNLGIHCALDNEFKIRNMPFFVDCPQQLDEVDASPPGKINWKAYLLTADYVVDKIGDDLGGRGVLEDIAGEFKESLEANYKMFEEIGSFKIREDFVYVYKRGVTR